MDDVPRRPRSNGDLYGYAERREVDLLNATVFGVKGQGGLLRELEGIRRQLHRNTQAIAIGAISMAAALIALAVAVANHG